MVNKKKYHGGLKVLLLLLFGMLLGISSTCYASMTREYLDYTIDTFKENYTNPTNTTQTQYIRETMTNLTDETKQSMLTTFNNNLQSRNLQNTINVNYIHYVGSRGSNYTFDYYIFVCNNGVPGENTQLDHFLLREGNISRYSSDTIYYQKWVLDREKGTALEPQFGTLTSQSIILNDYEYNTNYDILTTSQLMGAGIPAGFGRLPFSSSSGSIISIMLRNRNGNYIEKSEEPSGDVTTTTGTITNPSGEVTGNINLTNIENGINDINNNLNNIENKIPTSGEIQNILSGEVEKITNTLTDSADDLIDNTTITSGDIENALNFEIAQDPYSNFWFTLTNNLKSALLGTKRSIDISFQGRTWTISLDEYMVLPAWLIIILTPFSTAFFTWVLVRQFKLIFDKLASGNVDSLLKENSEERHFKFVLGGE